MPPYLHLLSVRRYVEVQDLDYGAGNELVYVSFNRTKKKKSLLSTRIETVLIKPAKGSSYTEILKNLKTKVQPNTLIVKINGSAEALLLCAIDCKFHSSILVIEVEVAGSPVQTLRFFVGLVTFASGKLMLDSLVLLP